MSQGESALLYPGGVREAFKSIGVPELTLQALQTVKMLDDGEARLQCGSHEDANELVTLLENRSLSSSAAFGCMRLCVGVDVFAWVCVYLYVLASDGRRKGPRPNEKREDRGSKN